MQFSTCKEVHFKSNIVLLVKKLSPVEERKNEIIEDLVKIFCSSEEEVLSLIDSIAEADTI